MSKHTPGPWTWMPESFHEDVGYMEPMVHAPLDDRGFAPQVAVVRVGLEGTLANAALIAAAPELLEALKSALDWWLAHPSPMFTEDDVRISLTVQNRMQAAIAKAEDQ